MKKFLKPILLACACAIIAVPFSGCDFFNMSVSKPSTVSEVEWNASTRNATKFAHRLATNTTQITTTYVDGNISKIINTDTEDNTNHMTYYTEKDGNKTWYYSYNATTNTWDKELATYDFDLPSLKYFLNNLYYDDFTYSKDKGYVAENYSIGTSAMIYDEIIVCFDKNAKLTEITATIGTDTNTIEFLSNNFTLTLPENVMNYDVDQEGWTTALNPTKYALRMTESYRGDDYSETYYVDGDIAKRVSVSPEYGTETRYIEKTATGANYINYDEDLGYWYKNETETSFEILSQKYFLNSYNYEDFDFNSNGYYTADNLQPNFAPITLDNIKIYFENGKLVKIVMTLNGATSTIEMLSTDFTITLPPVNAQ